MAQKAGSPRVHRSGLCPQCGQVIPGKAILAKNPNPTRKEIAKHLDVHLCRCTGYTKILDAVELAALRVGVPR